MRHSTANPAASAVAATRVATVGVMAMSMSMTPRREVRAG
jgi:hypothetical protein